MHHFWWVYLVVGMVVLSAVLVAHQRSKNPDLLYSRKDLSAANPTINKTWLILLSKVIVPILAAIAIVILWPLALGLWVQDQWLKRKQRRGHPEFSVKWTDLAAATTVDGAEGEEYVLDPLQAAPNLPFGHLNTAWKRFVEQSVEGDALWSFRSHWVNRWGDVELYTGYVWVSGRATKGYFLTEHLTLKEELPNQSRTPTGRNVHNVKY